MTPEKYNANPVTFKVGELIVSQRGQKSAALYLSEGKPLYLKLGSDSETLEAPFGLSSWDDKGSNRVSLDLRLTPEIEKCINAIDQNVLSYMEKNYKHYFGAAMTWEKVKEYFRPTIRYADEGKTYPPLLKTKLSKDKVKVWNHEKVHRQSTASSRTVRWRWCFMSRTASS